MKIGIFDSGLGGLLLLKAIRKKLPKYDYVYLGDTKRVPYGNHPAQTIYDYSEQCVQYLFKQDCELIIVACNTVSVEALRKLQQTYLKKNHPNKRILGVVVPTLEAIAKDKVLNVGLIGTKATVHSNAYKKELKKIAPKINLFQNPSPLLVPLIEENELDFAELMLKKYLEPLQKQKVSAIILGCTHYIFLKDATRKLTGKKIYSQDEIVPQSLAKYLEKHPEIEQKLTKRGTIRLLVTEKTENYKRLAKAWFGTKATLKQIDL